MSLTSTNPNVDSAPVALWVGCYTADMAGHGEGIVALGRGAGGGYEALGPPTPVPSPSFLALHPSRPVLYAVSERAARVHAFGHDGGGALRPLGEVGIASELVCHVAVAPDGAFLAVCCWGDGAVLVFELNADGSLGSRHTGPASTDPHGEARQSRAHSCLMLGGGRMVTAEMGHDALRFWRFTPERGLEPEGMLTFPHGSGPRHFARAASGLVYVNTEHSGQVAVLRPVGEWLEPAGLFPVSAGGVQAGDAAAEICLDPAERHLYVAVRGSDRICRLALDADGIPTPLDEFPCGGRWPRHHRFDGDRLVVALQRSDALAAFDLDTGTTPRPAATGSPTCVLPQH